MKMTNLLLLAVVVGGGYLIWKKMQGKKAPTTSTTSTKKTKTTAPATDEGESNAVGRMPSDCLRDKNGNVITYIGNDGNTYCKRRGGGVYAIN